MPQSGAGHGQQEPALDSRPASGPTDNPRARALINGHPRLSPHRQTAKYPLSLRLPCRRAVHVYTGKLLGQPLDKLPELICSVNVVPVVGHTGNLNVFVG